MSGAMNALCVKSEAALDLAEKTRNIDVVELNHASDPPID
jgi:hypothetical protein